LIDVLVHASMRRQPPQPYLLPLSLLPDYLRDSCRGLSWCCCILRPLPPLLLNWWSFAHWASALRPSSCSSRAASSAFFWSRPACVFSIRAFAVASSTLSSSSLLSSLSSARTGWVQGRCDGRGWRVEYDGRVGGLAWRVRCHTKERSPGEHNEIHHTA
jgi:hypothetical protein